MGFRGHSAAYGETGTGKTWIMTRTARAIAKVKGTRLVVCSPVGSAREWPRGTQFCVDLPGLEGLLALPENNRGGLFVFVDEAGDLRPDLERRGKYPLCQSLISRGRHRGITAFVASQRPMDVWPRWRDNVNRRYVFRLGNLKAVQQVWEDAGCPLLPDGRKPPRIIPTLPKLHCIRMIGGQTTAGLMAI